MDSEADSTPFQITKQHIGYEVAVYHLPAVASSPCFPKLFKYEVVPGSQSVRLELERLVTWRKFIVSKPFASILDAQVAASQVFLDCAEGLKVLHGARVVHGDISPGNIGFRR